MVQRAQSRSHRCGYGHWFLIYHKYSTFWKMGHEKEAIGARASGHLRCQPSVKSAAPTRVSSRWQSLNIYRPYSLRLMLSLVRRQNHVLRFFAKSPGQFESPAGWQPCTNKPCANQMLCYKKTVRNQRTSYLSQAEHSATGHPDEALSSLN